MTTPATPVTPAVSIPLPGIDIQRPARRGDGYRVTLGRFVGRGSTQDAAKADLARQIITTIESLYTAPAFARDDDGAVIAALDRPWGIDHYRVTDAGHRLVSTAPATTAPPPRAWRPYPTTRCSLPSADPPPPPARWPRPRPLTRGRGQRRISRARSPPRPSPRPSPCPRPPGARPAGGCGPNPPRRHRPHRATPRPPRTPPAEGPGP